MQLICTRRRSWWAATQRHSRPTSGSMRRQTLSAVSTTAMQPDDGAPEAQRLISRKSERTTWNLPAIRRLPYGDEWAVCVNALIRCTGAGRNHKESDGRWYSQWLLHNRNMWTSVNVSTGDCNSQSFWWYRISRIITHIFGIQILSSTGVERVSRQLGLFVSIYGDHYATRL